MKKILLFGYYGEGNLGDELILENLKKNLEKKFYLGVLTPNKDYYKDLVSFHKFKFSEILRGIDWADTVIGGGGGIFQDKTSFKSFLYYLSILWLSFLKRKKIYLLGQSFSPFRFNISRYLLKISLLICEEIYTRDKFSLNFLINMGIPKNKLFLIPDITFLTEFPQRDTNKSYVGINFRPWRGFNLNSLEEFLKVLKKSEKLIFFSFQDSLDLEFFNKLSSEIKEGIEIISYNNKNFITKFYSCKYFIGMRLHSLILASILGIPFLGISYDEKIEAYLEDLGWKFFLQIDELDKLFPLWIQLKEEEGLEAYLKFKVEEKRNILREEIDRIIAKL
ncbi:MAG: polysaccharide pyruvyl transferase CsaB [Dictyoglomaceae bacterium]|nr:polysaccharide pyruvyl transferase CsaB [Dictyoglomaceae bacterium]